MGISDFELQLKQQDMLNELQEKLDLAIFDVSRVLDNLRDLSSMIEKEFGK